MTDNQKTKPAISSSTSTPSTTSSKAGPPKLSSSTTKKTSVSATTKPKKDTMSSDGAKVEKVVKTGSSSSTAAAKTKLSAVTSLFKSTTTTKTKPATTSSTSTPSSAPVKKSPSLITKPKTTSTLTKSSSAKVDPAKAKVKSKEASQASEDTSDFVLLENTKDEPEEDERQEGEGEGEGEGEPTVLNDGADEIPLPTTDKSKKYKEANNTTDSTTTTTEETDPSSLKSNAESPVELSLAKGVKTSTPIESQRSKRTKEAIATSKLVLTNLYSTLSQALPVIWSAWASPDVSKAPKELPSPAKTAYPFPPFHQLPVAAAPMNYGMNMGGSGYRPQLTRSKSSMLFGSTPRKIWEEPVADDILNVGVSYLPFQFAPAKAIEMFEEWKASLWLLPHEFSESMTSSNIKAIFVPAYVFSAYTHTIHKGLIGHFPPNFNNMNNDPNNLITNNNNPQRPMLVEQQQNSSGDLFANNTQQQHNHNYTLPHSNSNNNLFVDYSAYNNTQQQLNINHNHNNNINPNSLSRSGSMTNLALYNFDKSFFDNTIDYGDFLWQKDVCFTTLASQSHPETVIYSPKQQQNSTENQHEQQTTDPTNNNQTPEQQQEITQDDVNIPYHIIKEIWSWKFDAPLQNGVPKPNNNANNNANNNTNNNTQNTDINKEITPVVLDDMPMLDGWQYAKSKLLRNESYSADTKLRREFVADVVDSVSTETRFSHVAAHKVYLPVYAWACEYDGVLYRFIINGQSGAVHGERPWAYGVGRAANAAMRAITGGATVGCMVLPGKELCEIDKVDSYTHSRYYFTWPSSDQFLLWIATGWITLKNSSTETITVQTQKRFARNDDSDHLHEFVLQGKQQIEVPYKGYWCVCVVTGDYRSLSIVKVSTNAGQGKEDLFGMAS